MSYSYFSYTHVTTDFLLSTCETKGKSEKLHLRNRSGPCRKLGPDWRRSQERWQLDRKRLVVVTPDLHPQIAPLKGHSG